MEALQPLEPEGTGSGMIGRRFAMFHEVLTGTAIAG
jgi:hypothetical protein